MSNHQYSFPMNPALISTFLAVAEIGKIASAAKALNLSQPAVTAQVAKLESELQFPLFTRSVHGVQLTVQGKVFLTYAKSIAAMLTEAANLNKSGQEVAGKLSVMASTTIGNHVLPPVLCAFAQKYPRIAIQLEVLSTAEVIEKIHNGAASIGLVEGLSKTAQIRLEKLSSDQIFVVAHPDIGKNILNVGDLKKYSLIWRERGSGTRAVVEKALRRHLSKREISFQYEFGSTQAIKLAVMEKLGVGFLSRWSIENELGMGRLSIVSLPDMKIERIFSWVYPSGVIASSDRLFVDFTKQFLTTTGARN